MITRYNPELQDVKYTDDVEVNMEEFSVGDYVRFDDVSILLQKIGMKLTEGRNDIALELIEKALTFETEIDLSTCKEGDKLRIKLNDLMLESGISDIVSYVKPLPEDNLYDHEIKYSDGSSGTRCNNGHTFRCKRLPNDPDVIEIIGQ